MRDPFLADLNKVDFEKELIDWRADNGAKIKFFSLSPSFCASQLQTYNTGYGRR